MNKIAKTLILPIAFLALSGCGNQADQQSISSSSNSSSNVSSGQTLATVLDYFSQSMSAIAKYNFFEDTNKPTSTAIYTDQGCSLTYRNFGYVENPDSKNPDLKYSGLINVDASLAEKKSIEQGVYTWSKVKTTVDEKTSWVFTLGSKVYDGTYQEHYHNPKEIADNKASYIRLLRHESESDSKVLSEADKSALSGNFTLNKLNPTDESKELLISFAKALGVYDTISGISGMEFNYVNIYFGPIAPMVNVTFYTQYKGGYSSFGTGVTCSQFGTATIADIDSYIGEGK